MSLQKLSSTHPYALPQTTVSDPSETLAVLGPLRAGCPVNSKDKQLINANARSRVARSQGLEQTVMTACASCVLHRISKLYRLEPYDD